MGGGAGRNGGGIGADGPAGRFQGADDMGRLGHVDVHDAADLFGQHGVLLVAQSHTTWQLPDLPGAVALSMGALRRSCSTSDRSPTGGRDGSLSGSVEPKGGAKTVPCQLSGQ